MEKIIEHLRSFRPISEKLEARLRTIIRRYPYKRGKLMLEAGEIADHILFIESGLVRSFTDKKRKRRSGWFMKENDFIIAVISFLTRIPSDESLEALEDCECWGTTYAELFQTFEDFPEFLWHGFLILARYYVRIYKRLKDIIELNKSEYFAQLMKEDRDLYLRVGNIHLASYLGVDKRSVINYKNGFFRKTNKTNGRPRKK